MAEIQMPEKQETTTSSMRVTPSAKSEHLEPLVKRGEASTRKPRVERKLLNVFISEDADSVGDYLVWKVIVPAVQGMLRDAGHGIVDTVFGRSPSSGNYRGSYNGGYFERRSYDRPASYRRDYSSRYDRTYHDESRYDSRDSEVIFKSRAKATECLDIMYELVDRQGYVTIDQLSDLIDVDTKDRGRDDDEWGWYDIKKCRIRGTRDGYALELPRPEYIEERDRR